MNRQPLKGNWPMIIGAVGSFIYFGVGHFIDMADLIKGLLLGISVAAYGFGAVIAVFGFSRIRAWKKRRLHRQRY